MKNNHWFLVVSLVVVLSAGDGCSKQRERFPSAEKAINQKTEASGLESSGVPGRRGGGGPALGRGFGRGGRRWEAGRVVTLTAAEREGFEIQTVSSVLKPMRSQLRAMGKLYVPQPHKAIVSHPFPARIAEIHAVVGEWVKSGQKLLTLQSEEVGNAVAEYYKTQADRELARQNLDRERALFDRGAGAQKNVFSAEAQFKVAEAMLEAAEKKLHILGFTETQIKDMLGRHDGMPLLSLFSPISGKIVESKAILGAMVDQNVEILTLMDSSLLWVEAEIYERDIARVRLGQDAEVTVPAYPGEVFKGRISFIGDVLREETRTITVRTDVRNADSRLKPGMFADVNLAVAEDGKALVVPQEAVLDDSGEPIVFIPTADSFMPRVVKVGLRDNGWVQILEGLREGDKVVTAGNFQLKSKLYQEILKAAGIH